jgi:DNA-binding transcriptional LysR family regulator
VIDFRIKTFLAVTEAGNLSRAAERLGLTQPAVSQHLKHLEDRFGVPLLVCRSRSVTLTEAGELLRRYAAAAEADGARTEALMRERGRAAPLRFGATRTIGEYVLPDRIGAYLAEDPEAELRFRVDNTDALLAALRRGEIDFAFIEGIIDRDEFETRLFLRDAFIPVCAGGDELADGPVRFDRLLARRLIVREAGSGSRLLLERALEADNRRIDHFFRTLEVGNIEAIKRLVSAGTGIAFLYRQSVERELAAGTLARIDLESFDVSHDYSFVFLRGGLYAERYLAFLDFCRRPELSARPGPAGTRRPGPGRSPRFPGR